MRGEEEEAQPEAVQLFAGPWVPLPPPTKELQWAAPVMALCVALHRSHWICQKAQEKDIPFQHGEGMLQLRVPGAQVTLHARQSLPAGGKPFHPTVGRGQTGEPAGQGWEAQAPGCNAGSHPAPCAEALRLPLSCAPETVHGRSNRRRGARCLGLLHGLAGVRCEKASQWSPGWQADRQTDATERHMPGLPVSVLSVWW